MATTTAIATPDRIVRCRHMTQKHRSAVLEQCSGEALDPVGEILICQRHAALVLELIQRRANGLRIHLDVTSDQLAQAQAKGPRPFNCTPTDLNLENPA